MRAKEGRRGGGGVASDAAVFNTFSDYSGDI